MLKKILVVALTGLAGYAYLKRKQIAYSTLGTLAEIENRVRKELEHYLES